MDRWPDQIELIQMGDSVVRNKLVKSTSFSQIDLITMILNEIKIIFPLLNSADEIRFSFAGVPL